MPQPHGHQPPRTQDLPHPAPPPAPGPLDRIWIDPATTERDQGIRSDAANVASMLLGDCSGTPGGIAARLVELADGATGRDGGAVMAEAVALADYQPAMDGADHAR